VLSTQQSYVKKDHISVKEARQPYHTHRQLTHISYASAALRTPRAAQEHHHIIPSKYNSHHDHYWRLGGRSRTRKDKYHMQEGQAPGICWTRSRSRARRSKSDSKEGAELPGEQWLPSKEEKGLPGEQVRSRAPDKRIQHQLHLPKIPAIR
jgi:hypothetical protein